MNYPAGASQANGGEPSIGTDWNPNVPSLKHDLVNTGGVALYTTAAAVNSVTNWRANFDDCSSPAVNLWENISVQTTPAGLDVIGFTDHYSAGQLGIAYPPPHTPGRHFFIALDLFQTTTAIPICPEEMAVLAKGRIMRPLVAGHTILLCRQLVQFTRTRFTTAHKA
jgi:hypothetical protein